MHAKPADHASPQQQPALIGRRLLALLYDSFPALAMWFLVAVPFVLMYSVATGDVRKNIEPFSALHWLLIFTCWAITGLYATASWRRGGQTLGMRPWRLRVVSMDGGAPTRAATWRRYAVATLSLLAAGAGFWWAWFDRDRLTWHDRAGGTRVVRVPKAQ